MDFLTNNLGLIGGCSATAVAMIVLKMIPNDKICSVTETFFFGLGRTITLGLAKWSYTKKVWNVTVEPYLVDLLDNVVVGSLRGFIKGLRIDNK